MAKVSILVAVYNAEKYLRKCLDSLLEQHLREIQIICVDDASTDSSRDILDEYALRDNRVEVIALPENVGQARARNRGLQVAKGEYVCFLDSDDWFSPDALQQAVETFDENPETDCVLFQAQMVSGETEETYPMPAFECLSGEEAFEKSLTWEIHGIYMARAQLYQEFPYDETAHSYSDDNTTRIHFLHSREVRQCKGIYYYRQHAESVTHQVSVRRFDYLRANESMMGELVNRGVCYKWVKMYENVRWLNLIDTYMFYFQNRHRLSQDECQYGLSEMKRVWKTIDPSALKWRNRYKFGYMPLHFSWRLFRRQEETYFTLRKLIKGK
ncbi:MAG: glycosyltransferase [Prevotella sp.]|nr:glycosyltransferase [Prevotella sp.]